MPTASARASPNDHRPAGASATTRSSVDLPQPDGPMNAVTLRGGTASDTSATAWKEP